MPAGRSFESILSPKIIGSPATVVVALVAICESVSDSDSVSVSASASVADRIH